MAMNGGNIEYQISADVTNAIEGFNNISKSLSHLQQMGYRLMQTGTVITAAITAPLVKAAQAGLNFDSVIEQAQTSFKTMLGSATQASNLVSNLTKLALETPLDVEGVQKASQTLLAYGLNAEKVIPTIRMVGDAALGNKDRFDRLILAYAQMTAAGRLMGRDNLQMIDAGFNPLLIISQATGMSMLDLQKKMEGAAISSELVAEAFRVATSEGGRFYNAMENATKTFEGQVNKLKEAISITFGKVMQPLFDELRLRILPALVEWLRKLQEAYDKLTPSAQRTITIVLALIAAIGPLIVIIGGLIFTLATLKIALMVIHPVTFVIIAALTALTGVLIALWNQSASFRDSIKSAWSSISTSVKDAIDNIMTYWNQNGQRIIDDINNSWQSLVTSAAQAWNWIATAVENAINAVGNLWNQYGVPVINSIALGWETLVAFVQPILQSFKESFVQLYNDLGPTWEAMKTMFGAFGDLFIALWDLLKPLLGLIGLGLYAMLKSGVEAFSGLVDTIGPAAKFIVEKLSSIVYGVTAVTKALNGDFSGAWESMNKAISFDKLAREDLFSIFNKYLEGAEQGGEAVDEGFNNAIDKIMQDKDELSKKWEEAKAGVGKLPSSTFNPISLPKIDVGNIFGLDQNDEAGKQIKNYAKMTLDELKIQAQDEANEVGKSMSKITGNFESLGLTGTSTVDKLTEALKDFRDSVKQTTDSFADFGNMFEKQVVERMSPEKIMRRLQKTFDLMQNWSNNLDTLSARGVSPEIIDSLRNMGLSSAGIVKGMARMSDTQLSKAQDLMWSTRYYGSKQGYESVKFEHSGQIWVYGINGQGELVDKGIVDMLAKEIKNGSQRYVTTPGVSKLLK
jgi:phage-related protein